MMNKRILSFLLAVILVIGLMPTSVFATENEGEPAPTPVIEPAGDGEDADGITPLTEEDEDIVPQNGEGEEGEGAESCTVCNEPGCEKTHTQCEACGTWDCEKTHTQCEVCDAWDCTEHKPCALCGAYDCGGEHEYCTECDKYNCGIDHNAACDKCGVPGCTSKHIWCDTCQKEDCGILHVWCDTCQKNDCGIDHTVTEPSEETTAPSEGTTVPEEETEPAGPQVGDKIWIKSGSYVYKDAEGNESYQLLGNYEVKVKSVITDENGNAAWYEFEFTDLGIGEMFLQWSGYKYVEIINTSVTEPEKEPEEVTGNETTVDGTTITLPDIPDSVSLSASAVDSALQDEVMDRSGVGSFAFAYDITPTIGGSDWQPTDGAVTVTLTTDLADGTKVGILHQNDDGTLESLGIVAVSEGTISFETSSFSAFFGYTVDFEYNGSLHSIEGGSSIMLSELFEILEVPHGVSEVTNVVFSDPSLVSVTAEDGDWKLESLEAFQTEETLTIALNNGETIIINVTDAETLPGGTLKLTGNKTYETGLIVSKNSTIDLNGYTLTAQWIDVNSNVTLTITGGGNGGTIRDTNTSRYRLFELYDGAKLKITGTSDKPITINGRDTKDSKSTQPLIYCHSAKLDLDYVTVKNCYIDNTTDGTTKHFGTIFVKRDEVVDIDIDRCIFENCGSYAGAAIMLRSTCKGTLDVKETVFQNCETWYSDDDKCDSGGVIRTNGGVAVTANITDCIFRNNTSERHGSAIYWNANGKDNTYAAKLNVKDCHFLNNTAGEQGGAIFLEGNMSIESTNKAEASQANTTNTSKPYTDNISSTLFYNNTAGENGGAIMVYSYSGGMDDYAGKSSTLTMGNNILIQNNSATNGGGLGMEVTHSNDLDDGFKFILKIDGTEFVGNTATSNGGGVWLKNSYDGYKTELELNSGIISGNNARKNGGGVHVRNTDVTFGGTGTGITITGNAAGQNGGGLSMNQDTGNSVRTVSVANGKIDGNTASEFGGGIYQTGSKAKSVISNNGSVSANEAANGGGIYVNGGSLTVSGGIITGNGANGTPENGATANGNAANRGVGGGVYVASGSLTMSAASGSEVGLYGNSADFAADDAYANGSGTSISLPNVHGMPLAGTPYAAVDGWYADYHDPDSSYESSPLKDMYPDKVNPGRYDEIVEGNRLSAGQSISAENEFYCLTLGITPYLYVEKIVYDKKQPTESFTFVVVQGSSTLGTVTFDPGDFKDNGDGTWSAIDKTTFDNMPVGDITVTESLQDKSKYKIDDASMVNDTDATLSNMAITFTMTDSGDKVTFVNKVAITDITITKTVRGAKPDVDEAENQSFIFRLKGNDENTKSVDMMVVINISNVDAAGTGTGTVKIKDVPIGSYTVTEVESWSWRYNATASEVTKTITSTVSENDFPFTNDRNKIYWLSGDSYCENNWGTTEGLKAN